MYDNFCFLQLTQRSAAMLEFTCSLETATWERMEGEEFCYYQVLSESQEEPTEKELYETLRIQEIVDFLFNNQNRHGCLVKKENCVAGIENYLKYVANTYHPTDEWKKENSPVFLNLGCIHEKYEKVYLYVCCHYLDESKYLCGMTILSTKTDYLTEFQIPIALKYSLPPYHPLEITLDELTKISGMF